MYYDFFYLLFKSTDGTLIILSLARCHFHTIDVDDKKNNDSLSAANRHHPVGYGKVYAVVVVDGGCYWMIVIATTL
jgi:hypothetical protein